MKTNKPTPIESVAPVLTEMAQTAPSPLNPEDLTSFALGEEFQDTAAKKVLTTVPVRKPAKESFVRTHPNPAYWAMFGILELKETGKVYVVAPNVAAALRDESESTLCMANLVLSVDRRGNPFLWPLKVSERENDWNNSARRAAELAKTQWLRVAANMAAGAYDIMVAVSQDAVPAWPTETYGELLNLAFNGRIVSTLDHPVLLELRGH